MERRSIDVHIAKGIPTKGAKVTLGGESDEHPGAETGDLVFHIMVTPHPVFNRLHHHLLMDKEIPLVGALTGVAFDVVHLDGRIIHVSSKPNEVIQPGSFFVIPGAGMPLASSHYRFGDLIIRFNVVFPPSGTFLRSPAESAALEKLLPSTMDPKTVKELKEKRRKEKAEDEEDERSGSHSMTTEDDYVSSPVLTGAAARAPRPSPLKPAGKVPSKSSSKGGKTGGSAASPKSPGGEGEAEEEDDGLKEEEAQLVPCSLESKILEAKSQQQEDARCVLSCAFRRLALCRCHFTILLHTHTHTHTHTRLRAQGINGV